MLKFSDWAAGELCELTGNVCIWFWKESVQPILDTFFGTFVPIYLAPSELFVNSQFFFGFPLKE